MRPNLHNAHGAQATWHVHLGLDYGELPASSRPSENTTALSHPHSTIYMRRAPPIVASGAPIWRRTALIGLEAVGVDCDTPAHNATLDRVSGATMGRCGMHPVFAR